jgi:hypothetical protein
VRAARSGRNRSPDATANTDAIASPTGWARSKPMFGWEIRMPGVASACRARNPAVVRKASETRNSRASVCRRAVTLIRAPSHTLTPATTRTSQKWLGWCCQTASTCGRASSSHSAAIGSARCRNQTSTRAGCTAGGRWSLSVPVIGLLHGGFGLSGSGRGPPYDARAP